MNTRLETRARYRPTIPLAPPLSRRALLLAVTTSALAALFTIFQGLPLWTVAIIALIPVLPVFTGSTVEIGRLSGWMALFYVLVATQLGHVVEHVAQMAQIHLLDTAPPHAHGIFGALDIEWVHLLWNTWVVVAMLALLYRYRRNTWLWSAALIALWHEAEHLYIMSTYLTTGRAGSPGLLSQGGELNGGLPFIRPDVHFGYNLIETSPLIIAFVVQMRQDLVARRHAGQPEPPRRAVTARSAA